MIKQALNRHGSKTGNEHQNPQINQMIEPPYFCFCLP